MKSHFELCMHIDGYYFVIFRTAAGDTMLESPRFRTRGAAVEAMKELVQLCGRDSVPYYDRSRRAWHSVCP